MRCSKCGRVIDPSGFDVINGRYFCRECARSLKLDSFLDLNVAILDDIRAAMDSMEELEFSNNDIICPNCQLSMRELEQGSPLGCVQCYSTFASEISRRMLRLYGDEEFQGREPGTKIDYDYMDPAYGIGSGGSLDTAGAGKAKATKEKEASKDPSHKDITERIAKSDFGALSDEQLTTALQKAIEKEDYPLAARIRDELNSRKGGTDNE